MIFVGVTVIFNTRVYEYIAYASLSLLGRQVDSRSAFMRCVQIRLAFAGDCVAGIAPFAPRIRRDQHSAIACRDILRKCYLSSFLLLNLYDPAVLLTIRCTELLMDVRCTFEAVGGSCTDLTVVG